MGTFSVKRADHWEIALHLIFDSNGGVRMTRGPSALNRNERAMALTVKVPLALFAMPTLRATIDVDAVAPVIPPIDLTAAAGALKGALGVDVDIRVIEPCES